MTSKTNDHKRSGLKQRTHLFSFNLILWRSEAWNQFHWCKIKVSAGLTPSRDFRGKLLSFPFPASRVVFLGSWPLPPASKSATKRFQIITTLAVLPPSYKHSCVVLGHPDNPVESPHLKIFNLIPSAKSLLPSMIWRLGGYPHLLQSELDSRFPKFFCLLAYMPFLEIYEISAFIQISHHICNNHQPERSST